MHVSKTTDRPQHKHRSSGFYCRTIAGAACCHYRPAKSTQARQNTRKHNELSSAYNATVQLRDGPVWLQTVSGCSRLIEVTNSLQQSAHDQMCSSGPARSKREWSATSTMPPQRGHFGRCERKRGLVWAAARNCANKIWYVGSVVIADVSSRRTPGSGPLWADARMLEWH